MNLAEKLVEEQLVFQSAKINVELLQLVQPILRDFLQMLKF